MNFDLREYIVVFENVIPNDLCEEILNEYKNDNNWVSTSTKGGVDKSVRNCDAIDMSNSLIINIFNLRYMFKFS